VNVNNFLWRFGDGGTSVLASASHLYKADGTYTVTLVVSNACGSDSTKKSIVISSTGIENQENIENIFRIYPNPASEKLFIEANISGNYSITLSDLQGRSLGQIYNFAGLAGNLDISKLASG